jgi:hypothetical protein
MRSRAGNSAREFQKPAGPQPGGVARVEVVDEADAGNRAYARVRSL